MSFLNVNDIFWSFQGEGGRMGEPSIFVRLQGCSLHCPFCDTKESWPSKNQTPIETILRRVENLALDYPGSQVVITGGEPLEQDISLLVMGLKERHFFVSIETNGKRYQPVAIDWWTVSPKEAAAFELNPELTPHINELKLVVTPGLTVDIIESLHERVANVSIYLQPQAFDEQRFENTYNLLRRSLQAGVANVRCGIQMHKVYKVK